MHRLTALGAIVAASAVLCACTAQTPATAPKPTPTRAIPTSWEDIETGGVALYSWTMSHDGSLTGAEEAAAADNNWNVKTASNPLTGKIADGVITLTIGGTPALGGGATYTGRISPFTLTLSGVATDGTPHTWTLLPSSQPKFQRDVGTFTAKTQQEQQAALTQQADDALNQAIATFRKTVTDLQTAMSAQAAAVTAKRAVMTKFKKTITVAKAQGCDGGPTGKAADDGYAAVSEAFATLGSADAALQGAAVDEATARSASAFDTDGLDIGPELDAGDSLATKANQIVSDTQKMIDTDASTQSSLYASVTTMPGC